MKRSMPRTPRNRDTKRMVVKLADIFSVLTDYLLDLEQRELLDVTGLSKEKIAHIRQLVDDLRDTKVK